jgi:tRNA 2-thiouridine synthesizing protein A
MEKNDSLDTRGLMCPMPIVKMAKKMRGMAAGSVLELISDDIGSKEDVPDWCERTGNELIGQKEEGGTFYFYVRKKQ